jgi:hypothetical protein
MRYKISSRQVSSTRFENVTCCYAPHYKEPATTNRYTQPEPKIFYPLVQCLTHRKSESHHGKELQAAKTQSLLIYVVTLLPKTKEPQHNKYMHLPKTQHFVHKPNNSFTHTHCNHEIVMKSFTCPEPSSTIWLEVQCLTSILQISSKHKQLHTARS